MLKTSKSQLLTNLSSPKNLQTQKNSTQNRRIEGFDRLAVTSSSAYNSKIEKIKNKPQVEAV